MATPTQGKHAPVAATPPVSTPFSGSQSHLAAFSPHGPRSVVPSPQQFKKSPANSNTLYGHPTHSSFGAMNFDSPNTAAALSAMPQLADHVLDAAMASTAGLQGPAPTKVNVEEEKRKKLQQVIDILKIHQGRVSEEGIERLARRLGLSCLWEDQMGSSGSIRTLVLAGTGLSLEFDLANNAVGKVSLSFHESPEIVTRHADSAAEILFNDLRLGPVESPLTKMLDKFAINLERLAALDKLSVMPALNCHEAIAGIYESLRRLHEWEVSRLKDDDDMKGKSEEYITRTAMCMKSGQPVMNARQNVGLSLDYWQGRHTRPKRLKGGAAKVEDDGKPKTWSLLVECAPSTALVYPSVRVTDKWISTDIRKANPTEDDLMLETGGPVLDWQDPEDVLLTSSETKGEGAMEGIEQELNISNSKLPDVMFVAKFNPSLLVPYEIANQIHSSTGSTMEQGPVATLDGYLFPPKPDDKAEADASYRRIRRQRSVLAAEEEGRKVQKIHKNVLTFEKLEYGHLMNELPFSHPRQLVALLPILRQYACLASLLDKSFGVHTEGVTNESREVEEQHTIRDEFDAFMSDALSEDACPPRFDKLPVDVSLHTQPHPVIRLTFPFRTRTADICFDVGVNASVNVVFENVLDDDEMEYPGPANGGRNGDGLGKGKGKKLTKADLGKILDVSGDLGIFVEFVRWRLR